MSVSAKKTEFASFEPVVRTNGDVVRLQAGIDAAQRAAVTDSFRLAMRELASGVSVITTGTGEGRNGLTATSVTSLSMAPASLLVCVQATSAALAPLMENGRFAVNVLAQTQSAIADLFAGRGGIYGAARFSDPAWREGETGVPVLTSALAAVECTLSQIVEWHSHRVLFGTVDAVQVSDAGNALVYCRGLYATPQELG